MTFRQAAKFAASISLQYNNSNPVIQNAKCVWTNGTECLSSDASGFDGARAVVRVVRVSRPRRRCQHRARSRGRRLPRRRRRRAIYSAGRLHGTSGTSTAAYTAQGSSAAAAE